MAKKTSKAKAADSKKKPEAGETFEAPPAAGPLGAVGEAFKAGAEAFAKVAEDAVGLVKRFATDPAFRSEVRNDSQEAVAVVVGIARAVADLFPGNRNVEWFAKRAGDLARAGEYLRRRAGE